MQLRTWVYFSLALFIHQSLTIRKKELPSNHSDNASTFYELAKCYVAREMKDKATLCYREAYRIWKSNNQFDDAGTASFELVRKREGLFA